MNLLFKSADKTALFFACYNASYMWKRWKEFKKSPLGEKISHHWLTLMFIFGFLNDFLLLNKVDSVIDNVILLLYVLLAMCSILSLYAATAGKLPERWNDRVRKYSQMVMQYAFGGLFSGMLIFYGRSSSLLDAWPFLLIFAAAIYLNETVKDRTGRLVVTIAMFFIGLLSYMVLLIPVLTGKMGDLVFIGSGFLALLIIYGLLRALRLIIPNFLALHMRQLVFVIGTIYAIMNFLYFTNIIPPIPLSLKDVGIYHSVVRFDDGNYQLKYEPGSWWQFWKRSDNVFHPTSGDNVFCFASIYAPARLSTDIYHRWEYYDENKGEWVTQSRLRYYISGGRASGYRGYTQIGNYFPGKWRCTVETERGQLLGRERFTIEEGAPSGDLVIRND